MKRLIAIAVVVLLSACTGIPDKVEPVSNFELSRYLGKWYEIARLDHRFERGLSQISAEYSLRDDGGVRVLNRGYSAEDGEWREAEGRAYFMQAPDVGYLKVSFFGPFYGSYIVFDLDRENYQYALISGPDKSFFWLLARTPTISDEQKARLVARAAEAGFDTSKLIFPSAQ